MDFIRTLLIASTISVTTGLTCTISSRLGCFDDVPTRVASFLADVADTAMTLETCRDACAVNGFSVLAATAHALPTAEGYCYCSTIANPSSQKVDDSFCNVTCPGDRAEVCGGLGYSTAVYLTCDGPLPPQPVGPPLAAGRACSQPESRTWPFCNQSLSVEDRLTDLVSRLTVGEIGLQLTSRESPAIPRLGIPGFYWGSNAIHGVLAAGCLPGNGPCPTSWPDGVAMASTWNRSAWKMMGFVTGRESRGYDNSIWSQEAAPTGGLTLWGPTINILRDPRWGRVQESASEDPYLAGEFGASVSIGAQNGTDPRYLLSVVTLKHFAMYSLEDYGPPSDPHEWMRQTFNAVSSPYDLADTYFPAFKASIQKGGAAGIMYAANEANGVPCAGSSYLDTVLHSWGFDGYRCTDGGQIINMVDGHHFVPTLDQAIAYAIGAESDIADGPEYATGLPHAFMNGNATMAGIQNLARNIFRIRMRLGQFDSPLDQPYLAYSQADIGAPDAVQSQRLASREALVLLKNDGALPLSTGPQWKVNGSVAVIGPNGNNTVVLQGNYGGQYCHPGPHGPEYDCLPSVFTAVQASYASGAVFAQGCVIDVADPTLLAEAVTAALAAKVVLMVLGLDQSQEREQHDRYNITLPDSQVQLFQAVYAAVGGKIPIVVVLVHGGALAIPEIAVGASAIIDAFYPGVTAGQAIADALFGIYNPGGKLPYTIYPPEYQFQYNFTSMAIAAGRNSSERDWYAHSSTAWALLDAESRALALGDAGEVSSPVGRTYRYYTGTPMWPFGFGLSYTTFTLAWTGSAPPAVIPFTTGSPPLTFNVTVTNSGPGAVDGDEVVQAYMSPVPGSFGIVEPPFLPIKQLWDFSRMRIVAGQAVICPFTLDVADLALTLADGTRLPLPGQYNITVSRGTGPVLSFVVQVTQ